MRALGQVRYRAGKSDRCPELSAPCVWFPGICVHVCVHLRVPIQGVQGFSRGSLAPLLLSCELLSVTAMKTIAGSLAKPWPFLSITRPVPRRKERPEAASGCRRHSPF